MSGLDAIGGLPRKVVVTSEEIREALAAPLEAIVDTIKLALDQTTPDLASDLVDHGLVLAGGGALLPGLDRFLSECSGLPVRVSPGALVAVAKGTQICLEDLTQWRPALASSDDEV